MPLLLFSPLSYDYCFVGVIGVVDVVIMMLLRCCDDVCIALLMCSYGNVDIHRMLLCCCVVVVFLCVPLVCYQHTFVVVLLC